MTFKEFISIYKDFWKKNVKCICKNGEEFIGIYIDDEEEENVIYIGAYEINVNEIKKMEAAE